MACPTFTSNASACGTMEINAVGIFLRDILVAGPLGPFHLDLPFLFASLVVYLPETRQLLQILHRCFCVVELSSLYHDGRCVTLIWPQRKTVFAPFAKLTRLNSGHCRQNRQLVTCRRQRGCQST
jgi:hypothetical protein